MVVYQLSVPNSDYYPPDPTVMRLATGKQQSPRTDDSGVDAHRDHGGGKQTGAPFHVVDVGRRGPFRYAVHDSTGVVRDAFRSRRSAEHAARMLGLGAGYDPHAVLGARVFPLSTPAAR